MTKIPLLKKYAYYIRYWLIIKGNLWKKKSTKIRFYEQSAYNKRLLLQMSNLLYNVARF